MVILLLGKNGQVGWELQRSLMPLGKVIALDARSIEWCGDLSRPEELRATIRNLRPDVIVNAAAYTAVDKAETEYALAKLINTDAVAAIAEESRQVGALFVHYSTDYVYPGEGEIPWKEEDTTDPVNNYGKTKRAGEEAIELVNGAYLIFRTSWVFAARGNNFVRTMLRLAKEKEKLSVINDQNGAPTSAELIADVTAHAIRQSLKHRENYGVYHLAASGATTWFDYANKIFSIAREHNVQFLLKDVNGISTAEYPTAALRPRNSRLNLEKIESTFGLTMPDWEVGIRRVVKEIVT